MRLPQASRVGDSRRLLLGVRGWSFARGAVVRDPGWRGRACGSGRGVSVGVNPRACARGAVVVCTGWGGVNIHANEAYAIRWACKIDYLALARWLVRQDPQYDGWPAAVVACLRVWGYARAGWMRSVVSVLVGRV